MTTAIAIAALIIASCSYFALRWTEESRRMDDLIATVLSTDLPDDECECRR